MGPRTQAFSFMMERTRFQRSPTWHGTRNRLPSIIKQEVRKWKLMSPKHLMSPTRSSMIFALKIQITLRNSAINLCMQTSIPRKQTLTWLAKRLAPMTWWLRLAQTKSISRSSKWTKPWVMMRATLVHRARLAKRRCSTSTRLHIQILQIQASKRIAKVQWTLLMVLMVTFRVKS